MKSQQPPVDPDSDPAHDDAAPDEQGLDDAAAPGSAASVDAEPDFREKWLRALAEAENSRRTARLDIEEARRFGATPTLRALVGVLDNLQRALATPGLELPADFAEGLRLIEEQFRQALGQAGVVRVPAERGQPLDPHSHSALAELPDDELPPGAIVSEIVPGYRLHERLLREAQVIVARARSAQDSAGGAG